MDITPPRPQSAHTYSTRVLATRPPPGRINLVSVKSAPKFWPPDGHREGLTRSPSIETLTIPPERLR
ncbi:hypothetical protein RHGRI_004450 [Rhododendron griersonianum]|uniref:Uncharacterized protein n=1 Tax=Rhododendron griersonianum TaxID=479676 RepID=A0AAV6LBL7_9ERIC|nr:hypothetical protein RHGRI_004450 [Rhododendron griersonianum]